VPMAGDGWRLATPRRVTARCAPACVRFGVPELATVFGVGGLVDEWEACVMWKACVCWIGIGVHGLELAVRVLRCRFMLRVVSSCLWTLFMSLCVEMVFELVERWQY
jgi:hypothetical protein